MTKRLASVLALLVECASACACASATPHGEPARLSALVVVPGTPDARPLLDAPSSVAAAAGAGPLVVVAAGEASERERMGAFVDVPADACIVAYARGGDSVDDLDANDFRRHNPRFQAENMARNLETSQAILRELRRETDCSNDPWRFARKKLRRDAVGEGEPERTIRREKVHPYGRHIG